MDGHGRKHLGEERQTPLEKIPALREIESPVDKIFLANFREAVARSCQLHERRKARRLARASAVGHPGIGSLL